MADGRLIWGHPMTHDGFCRMRSTYPQHILAHNNISRAVTSRLSSGEIGPHKIKRDDPRRLRDTLLGRRPEFADASEFSVNSDCGARDLYGFTGGTCLDGISIQGRGEAPAADGRLQLVIARSHSLLGPLQRRGAVRRALAVAQSERETSRTKESHCGTIESMPI